MFRGVLGRLVSDDGAGYTVFFVARKRTPTMWDGLLEFVGDEGRTMTTGVETTQPSVVDVENWARALSSAHLEGALARVREPRRDSARTGGSPWTLPPTPVDRELRRAHLREIETYVLRFIAAHRALRIPTEAIFRNQQFSNADLVRAFEVLEKQFRFVIRATVDGIDWLYLTTAGARFLGIRHQAAGEIERRPPSR